MKRLLRTFFAFFALATSFSALATEITFEKADFTRASRGAESVILADLSESGAAKAAAANQNLGQEIELHVAGERLHFKLRTPIEGLRLQMGPFAPETARQIVSEINR